MCSEVILQSGAIARVSQGRRMLFPKYRTHSFWKDWSRTSTICSIRLFADSSSDPTVMRTGSLRNVAAKRLTDSGHVAETAPVSERLRHQRRGAQNVHMTVCRPLVLSGQCAMIRLMSFSNPASSIRSASSRHRYLTLSGQTPLPVRSYFEMRTLTQTGLGHRNRQDQAIDQEFRQPPCSP